MGTRELLTALRWSAPPAPVDWAAVERAVGRRYPAESRQIAAGPLAAHRLSPADVPDRFGVEDFGTCPRNGRP